MTPAAARDERRQALRALLARPCLVAGRDTDELALVRRHAGELEQWLSRHTGWHLHVERRLARLYKRPANLESASRGALDAQGTPFSRGRYVLLCLALAALERAERQTTLRTLADDILASAQGDAALNELGFQFSLETRDERRDLVVIVRWLMERGALVRMDGDEEDYVSGRSDVLYRVDTSLTARLPQWITPPSLVAEADFERRLEALAQGQHVVSEGAERTAMRHRLARTLLDDPVLYLDRLEAEESDYLSRVRGTVVKELAEATGLVVEDRAEGIALSDPGGTLTDAKLPEEGTEGHVTLLVAELLATKLDGDTSLPLDAIAEHIAEMRAEHGRYWRKAAREPGSELGLARMALARLRALDLAVPAGDDHWKALPAVARYALAAPQTEDSR